MEPETDYIWNNEKVKEECGVFGIFDNDGHDVHDWRIMDYFHFNIEGRKAAELQ